MKRMMLILAAAMISQVICGQHGLKEQTIPGTGYQNIFATYYDLQTNQSCPNRLYLFPDGSIGSVITGSRDNSGGFADRGTFYNYFDGTGWGVVPQARVETVRAGWPSYAPYGAGGELFGCHQSGNKPLLLCRRDTKGAGSWAQVELPLPAGVSGMFWPRIVTNGTNHKNIHLLAVTSPTENGGSLYNGLDGALLYNQSLDGGATWAGWQLLPGMTSSAYLGFSHDSYAMAEPRGDTLAFVCGDKWQDEFIMKSVNNGNTWTKTVVWPCPYNLYTGPDSVAPFYCSDGSSAIVLDKERKAHVAFGLQRSSAGPGTPPSKYWYPYADGLIYWNEDMDPLPSVLSPDFLNANGNYLAGVPDTNVYHMSGLPYYYCSLTSMPQIIADDPGNNLFVIYSTVTAERDINNMMLRKLYCRTRQNGIWNDTFFPLTGDPLFTQKECVYPMASPTSDNRLYIQFMCDSLGGIYSNTPGALLPNENKICLLTPDKGSLVHTAVPGKQAQTDFSVSRVMPDPASVNARVVVAVNEPAEVTLSILSPDGSVLQNRALGRLTPGKHTLTMDLSRIPEGFYLCRVTLSGSVFTKKFLVTR